MRNANHELNLCSRLSSNRILETFRAKGCLITANRILSEFMHSPSWTSVLLGVLVWTCAKRLNILSTQQLCLVVHSMLWQTHGRLTESNHKEIWYVQLIYMYIIYTWHHYVCLYIHIYTGEHYHLQNTSVHLDMYIILYIHIHTYIDPDKQWQWSLRKPKEVGSHPRSMPIASNPRYGKRKLRSVGMKVRNRSRERSEQSIWLNFKKGLGVHFFVFLLLLDLSVVFLGIATRGILQPRSTHHIPTRCRQDQTWWSWLVIRKLAGCGGFRSGFWVLSTKHHHDPWKTSYVNRFRNLLIHFIFGFNVPVFFKYVCTWLSSSWQHQCIST